eukprot:TRINITY_DN16623_c0_g1_i1.p1 TRINITY_DN16623_c0_g1~~TRINITY_DN16623_c0_g1_i1.p1  ORF type:complete len:181 (+),score=4.75 TRINITY_DN16623_c0_g1_i1:19-561(+)
MLKRTAVIRATGGNRQTSLYEAGRAPTSYYHQKWGVMESQYHQPHVKGHMLWRKLIKENPRMMSWEREETPSHLKRYHRPDVNWEKTRYQYLTINDEELPRINLGSEDMQLLDLEDWRGSNRVQLEGYFGNLRQRIMVPVPNNYNIIQRHQRCLDHANILRDRARSYPKYHPKEDELLDF